MPAIGKSNPIIDILHRKTKIRKEDIIDLFRVLPECMADAVFESNLLPGESLYVGGVSFYINAAGKTSVKATKAFKLRLQKLKQGKINPTIQ